MAPPRPSLLRPTFLLALLGPLPGVALKLGLLHTSSVVLETSVFGVAVLGAAFLLAWAAEVAQLDISQTLAIAVLALIAVLPEYAVDLFLAFRAGQGDEEKRHLAIANMTGANRLLIGVGWAVVVLIFLWKSKGREKELRLRPEQRTDVGFLLVATLWAFTIPIRGEVGLLDLVLLGGLFIAYIFRAAQEEVEEPDLIGAAAALGALRKVPRRVATVTLFFYAAASILLVHAVDVVGLHEAERHRLGERRHRQDGNGKARRGDPGPLDSRHGLYSLKQAFAELLQREAGERNRFRVQGRARHRPGRGLSAG